MVEIQNKWENLNDFKNEKNTKLLKVKKILEE